jgi:O-antigen/teichoic acid export membrane protein
VVEVLILSFFIGFLVPAGISLVSDPPLTANLSENIKSVVHLLIALPFYCFLGAIFNVLLINLLTPLDKEQRRRYIKFGVLLTLIVPALLLIVIFAPQIFSKSPEAEAVPTD